MLLRNDKEYVDSKANTIPRMGGGAKKRRLGKTWQQSERLPINGDQVAEESFVSEAEVGQPADPFLEN